MTYAAANWSPCLTDAGDPATAVAAVVLAGGASRRMSGRPKALLPWPPQDPVTTFLGSICSAFREAGVQRIAVVAGAHHRQIAAAAAADGPPILDNPRHEEGQLTTLWRGLDWAEGLDPGPHWLAVALVDAPGIAPATIRALCAAAAALPTDEPEGASPVLVRPVTGARHGHPVLWHRSAWPLLRACPLQLGARPAVRALAAYGRVVDLPVDDPAVLRDIDTDEDYRALLNARA